VAESLSGTDDERPGSQASAKCPEPNEAKTAPTPAEQLDTDQFEQCYRDFAPGVRAALRARLVNELDVEGCLSRVFEKLWARGGLIPPASRRAWLFVVARNEAALLGRCVGRQVEKPATEDEIKLIGERGHSVPEPLEALLRQEEIQTLRQASRCLSDEQAEVIKQRFINDLTFREIASRLGIPLGTALSRARAAIKRLRDELDSPTEEQRDR
jgi:RNA polymerase sigma factor (sigma-70 family)